jgi:hypothetical protein
MDVGLQRAQSGGERRITMRKLLIALAAGLLLSLGVVHPAGATPPISGTVTVTFNPDPATMQFLGMRQAGGNAIVQWSWEQFLSGAFTGVDHVTGTDIFHADGHGTINASDVCDPCRVVDPASPSGFRTGVLKGDVQGTNTWVMGPMGPNVLSYHANIRGSGSGGLAGLHTEGTVDQPDPFSNATITIRYHFDP